MEKIWRKNTTALDGVICVQCKMWGRWDPGLKALLVKRLLSCVSRNRTR